MVSIRGRVAAEFRLIFEEPAATFARLLFIQQLELLFGLGVVLIGRALQPFFREFQILLQTIAVEVADPEIILRGG